MLPDESLVRILRCNDPVNAIAITPDGKKASSSSSWTLKVWDLQTGRCIAILADDIYNGALYAVAIAPDGQTVVSGSHDFPLQVWDLQTGTLISNLTEHYPLVTSLAITSDGRTVVSGSCDCTLNEWDLQTGIVISTLKGHNRSVYAVAITPDGKIELAPL